MYLGGDAVRFQQALDEVCFCRVLSDEDFLHHLPPGRFPSAASSDERRSIARSRSTAASTPAAYAASCASAGFAAGSIDSGRCWRIPTIAIASGSFVLAVSGAPVSGATGDTSSEGAARAQATGL
jgi:hypothetical protein